jgi:hypothetical protein
VLLVGYYEPRKLCFAGKVRAGLLPHSRHGPRVQVEHDRQIQPAFLGPNGGIMLCHILTLGQKEPARPFVECSSTINTRAVLDIEDADHATGREEGTQIGVQ